MPDNSDGHDDDDEDDDDEDDDDVPPSKKGRKAAAIMSQTDQVLQLCAIAGVSDSQAMKWARRGLSVTQVRNKIMDLRATADRDPDQRLSSAFEGSGAISALDRISGSARTILANRGQELVPVEHRDRMKGLHPAVATGLLQAESYNRLLTAHPGLYDQYDAERPTQFQNRAQMVRYSQALSARLAGGSGAEQILTRNTVQAPSA